MGARGLRLLRILTEKRFQPGDRLGADVQAELRAAPQDVLCGHRPLVPPQIVHLRPVQAVAQASPRSLSPRAPSRNFSTRLP